MKPFESKWAKIFPYLIGGLFGLSIAMLAMSLFMYRRAIEREPFLTTSDGTRVNVSDSRSGSSIVEARRLVSPAVVSVTAYRTEIVYARPLHSFRWFQQLFPGTPRRYEKRYPSLGSGLIVNSYGFILTNEHVIRDAEEIYVTTSDSTEVVATLIGSTAAYDLALLKIEGEGYTYATLGDSDQLEIGESVIAIGSPFPYLFNDTQPTVTVGVVSALHRNVKSGTNSKAIFKNLIQTDAAINPGNSGGPLVSGRGEVIGINTSIFSDGEGSNLGMGFAIPINTAKMVVEELRRYGRVREVWTGLVVSELTPQIANRLDFPVESGLLVERIDEGSPAIEAGIEIGDIIVMVNGTEIQNLAQANHEILGSRVGDILEIVIRRGDRSINIKLELAERVDRA